MSKKISDRDIYSYLSNLMPTTFMSLVKVPKTLPLPGACPKRPTTNQHISIVVDENKVLNDGGLRYQNEFVRHKALDSIGDLYLSGA